MLSKVCAACLIVLVLLPFTAPFSMFDLAELLSGQGVGSMGAPSSTTAALTRHTLSRAMPIPPLRAARHRPALTGLRASSVAIIPPVPVPRLSGAPAIHIVHPLTCPIVLRI